MPEDVKMITEGPAFIGFNHKESTPFSDVDETIIWEAELNTLILENDLSGIYDEFGPSSKKRKRDINTYKYNPSVFVVWKKNITGFSSRAATTINKSFLDKPI